MAEQCADNGHHHAPDRPELIKRALRLEYLTAGWNVVEGLIAVTAALAAGYRRAPLPIQARTAFSSLVVKSRAKPPGMMVPEHPLLVSLLRR